MSIITLVIALIHAGTCKLMGPWRFFKGGNEWHKTYRSRFRLQKVSPKTTMCRISLSKYMHGCLHWLFFGVIWIEMELSRECRRTIMDETYIEQHLREIQRSKSHRKILVMSSPRCARMRVIWERFRRWLALWESMFAYHDIAHAPSPRALDQAVRPIKKESRQVLVELKAIAYAFISHVWTMKAKIACTVVKNQLNYDPSRQEVEFTLTPVDA